MLAILERLDPHSDRIDVLADLVDRLRPRRARDHAYPREQVRTLTQLLKGNPAQAWALRRYLVRLLETRRQTSLYSDVGILSNDGFFTELRKRVVYRLLPPALDERYLSDTLDQVLRREDDHVWIRTVPDDDWLALFDTIAHAPVPDDAMRDEARRITVTGLLDAIRTLSCRVCALGLEPRLNHANLDIEEADSPFLMQNIEANRYLGDYRRLLAGEIDRIDDGRHLLVMLDQCEAIVLKIRRSALNSGTSVSLTYLLVALLQSIDRLRKLLLLVDDADPAASPRRQAALTLAQELIEAHNTKYRVRGLIHNNVDLLARNVTENASRTGEHYIAERRSDMGAMLRSSAGAGVVIGVMAMIKLVLAHLHRAPLIEALLFSLNYSIGFMLVHVLHFTIATKQPAMTAARIAAGLHSSNKKQVDADNMAALVNKVFRTQIVAVVGNLLTVIPVAWAIAAAWPLMFGHHLVDPVKAEHLIHDSHPWQSMALVHAAIAAVWLFVSGLVSGYYDNKALYTRMGQRVGQLRGLGRLLGPSRLERFARYVEHNLGGLMGNMVFGILMGCTATVGFLLGLPLDVRHVTFSSANLAIGAVGLDYHLDAATVGVTLLGIALIGAVNLIVSFGLALWVALRARKTRFYHGIRLLRALGRRLRAAPVDFFFGPTEQESVLPDAATTRGFK